MKRAALGAALTLTFAIARTAGAEPYPTVDAGPRPQANVGWVTGACGVGDSSSVWRETKWCNGFRADVLFGRARNAELAVGPYLQITSAGFWDARYGGGASLLWPVIGDFPIVLSLGAGAHELEAVQLEGWLFWGARSMNFHSSYSLAGGLLLGASRDLGNDGASTLFVGAQIDGMLFALPFIMAYQALR